MKYDTVINLFNFNRCIDPTFDFNLLYTAIGLRSLTVNGLKRINYIQSIVPVKNFQCCTFLILEIQLIGFHGVLF